MDGCAGDGWDGRHRAIHTVVCDGVDTRYLVEGKRDVRPVPVCPRSTLQVHACTAHPSHLASASLPRPVSSQSGAEQICRYVYVYLSIYLLSNRIMHLQSTCINIYMQTFTTPSLLPSPLPNSTPPSPNDITPTWCPHHRSCASQGGAAQAVSDIAYRWEVERVEQQTEGAHVHGGPWRARLRAGFF